MPQTTNVKLKPSLINDFIMPFDNTFIIKRRKKPPMRYRIYFIIDENDKPSSVFCSFGIECEVLWAELF